MTSDALTVLIHNFGERLHTVRVASEYSQKQLASMSGVGQDTISNYEQGKTVPKLNQVAALAEALDVPVAYFFCDANYENCIEQLRRLLPLIVTMNPLTQIFLQELIQHITRLHARRNFLAQRLSDDPERMRRVLEQEVADLQATSSTPSPLTIQLLVMYTTRALLGIDWKMDWLYRDCLAALPTDKQESTRL